MFHRTFASGTQTLRGKGDQYKTLQAWFGQHDVGHIPQISHACSEMENKEKQATERLHIPYLLGFQIFIGWGVGVSTIKFWKKVELILD